MQIIQSRRDFLTSLSAAGAAGVLGARRIARRRAAAGDDHRPDRQDPPGICIAPQYVAEDLLRAEGFTDIRYVECSRDAPLLEMIARGERRLQSRFRAELHRR